MALNPSNEELDLLSNSSAKKQKKKSEPKQRSDGHAFEIIKSALTQKPNPLVSIPSFKDLDQDFLIGIAKKIVNDREDRFKQLIADLKTISQTIDTKDGQNTSNKDDYTTPLQRAQGLSLSKGEEMNESVNARSPPSLLTVFQILGRANNKKNLAKINSRINSGLQLAKHLGVKLDSIHLDEAEGTLKAVTDNQNSVILAFENNMRVDPLGYLHLEKVSFIPAGIERGELVSSIPLAPGEQISISHKEWSNTSEEFQRIVTDYFEEYSEQGVAEKTELADSSSSQSQHSNTLNTGVTATGTYGPVSVSGSVNSSVSSSDSSSRNSSSKNTRSITSKASSRTKREHKVSFKIVTASGLEDTNARIIKNPFQDRATRLDYYQLVRKWKVDLYRYGLRLTYDITIPQPGKDIISRVQEISDIEKALGQGFGSSDPTAPSWAKFDLKLSDITRDDVSDLISKYGITSSDDLYPPNQYDYKYFSKTFLTIWEERYQTPQFHTLEIEVDERYEVESTWWTNWAERFSSDGRREGEGHPVYNSYIDVWGSDEPNNRAMEPPFGTEGDHGYRPEIPYLHGRTGKLQIVIESNYVADGAIYIELKLRLTRKAWQEWRIKFWNKLRESALARYHEQRQYLKTRLEQLKEELSSQDALSLRKMEREEIMKHVLRWLLGPSFEFIPRDAWIRFREAGRVEYSARRTDPDTGTSTTVRGYRFDEEDFLQDRQSSMIKILQHGDIIQFLHNAIEWENILYFLYPYFWAEDKGGIRKYMDHPDAIHKAFLRAGAARVVLTIRPGFEKSFVNFIESGQYDVIPDPKDVPYVNIAQEMINFANTNYQGIRSANPPETVRTLLTLNQQKTWERMQWIMSRLEIYKNLRDEYNPQHQYPSTRQGLIALKILEEIQERENRLWPGVTWIYVEPNVSWDEMLKDAWGNDFVYRCPGENGRPYDLISRGADGRRVNNDPISEIERLDIVSWAEASWIDTWYEYTPTSAMDIAFNETLPTT